MAQMSYTQAAIFSETQCRPLTPEEAAQHRPCCCCADRGKNVPATHRVLCANFVRDGECSCPTCEDSSFICTNHERFFQGTRTQARRMMGGKP
jgi:hypothetical protein